MAKTTGRGGRPRDITDLKRLPGQLSRDSGKEATPASPHMLNAGAAESRKKRNRLRAKARRRLRLVEDIPIAAHMEGVSLTDDEWRTIEKLARHAEHLTEEADRLGDELKRRRPKVSDSLPI